MGNHLEDNRQFVMRGAFHLGYVYIGPFLFWTVQAKLPFPVRPKHTGQHRGRKTNEAGPPPHGL